MEYYYALVKELLLAEKASFSKLILALKSDIVNNKYIIGLNNWQLDFHYQIAGAGDMVV